jgi:hypothetical protein
MNETRVELSKANELSNVANKFRSRQCFEQRMLGLSGTIAIHAYVDAYKLETRQKNMALVQIHR